MISPVERKKITRSIRPSHNAEMKKYEEVYLTYANTGYTKDLCDQYAAAFVDDVKKPNTVDVIQLAMLYEKIFDYKMAAFYLDSLEERKLGGLEKYHYCVEALKTKSLLGKWRDAEDFRTENIDFMQKQSEKLSSQRQADLYMALALTDCAAQNYDQALKLLKFGYKPQGKNDKKLLEIFITALYIFAKANDEEGVEGALKNANSCLEMFSKFDFSWGKDYWEKRIADASQGII
ncbi:MAG: hypothetical protein K6B38_13165 [Ruminococcus sp.]|nr:hypothetical protein [Ruminococcus sp.]